MNLLNKIQNQDMFKNDWLTTQSYIRLKSIFDDEK